MSKACNNRRRKARATRKLAHWRSITPWQGLARWLYQGSRAYMRKAQRQLARDLSGQAARVTWGRTWAIGMTLHVEATATLPAAVKFVPLTFAMAEGGGS
jgi:hypothetical protein